MVFVMYGGVLFAVFVAVILAATKDARLVKEVTFRDQSEFPCHSHHVANSAPG
jgi:hypothetical protein